MLFRSYVPVSAVSSRFFLSEPLAKDPVRLFVQFEGCVSFIFAFFAVFLFRHMRNKMAGRPRAAFAQKRTGRLLVEEGMTVDALPIIQSLPDFQPDITGVVPLYGGKCFDSTLANPDAATRLATAGFDYECTVKPLRLLGPKNIHVSIFVSVEFPDEQLLPLLQQYGQLKSTTLRRLYFAEEGYQHIERGIRVAEFLPLDKDLPRKIVTQGLEIAFKYTGQPVTCYRCGSTEHLVKDCPKQRQPRQAWRQPGGRLAQSPPPPLLRQRNLPNPWRPRPLRLVQKPRPFLHHPLRRLLRRHTRTFRRTSSATRANRHAKGPPCPRQKTTNPLQRNLQLHPPLKQHSCVILCWRSKSHANSMAD